MDKPIVTRSEGVPEVTPCDAILIKRALDGDHTAFDMLFGRYQEALNQMYMQKTAGNEPDSKDMLQDTFIKVYLNLHKYNSEYTFSQWIFTIARNTFIDFTRKRRDGLLSIDNKEQSSAVYQPISSMPTPEERLIIDQHSSELNLILTAMSPRYREIIVLRFFNEYSYEEIAERMNIPIGTVKTLIHRGREQLLSQISSKNGILL